MAKLIINYAIKNDIKLKVNDKNKFNYYPILCSVRNNNIEMVKLIVDYASKTSIKLNTEETDIKEVLKMNKTIEEILENYNRNSLY